MTGAARAGIGTGRFSSLPASSAGMARVELTAHLSAFFPQLEGRQLMLEAGTVADIIDQLEKVAPGIAFYLCDEARRLRKHVNVFVDGEIIADRRSLSDEVADDSCVFIAQALSGG